MSKYSNLPGIDVNISDGGLIMPEDTRTESLLIIGQSRKADAPKEPVLIRQSADLEAQGFGGFVEDSEINKLAVAWKAAHEAGNHRIYLMSMGKLVGDNVEDVAYGALTEEDKFYFLQDALNGPLTDFSINHVVLLDAKSDVRVPLSESFNDQYGSGIENTYITENTVKTEITSDNDTLVINGETVTLDEKDYADINALVVEVQDELRKSKLDSIKASSVDGKLRLSSDSKFTVGEGTTLFETPGEITSERHGNFASLLGGYAEQQTLSNNSTIGYIGVAEPEGNSLRVVKNHVDRLVSTHNEYSGYVQVVAAPELGYRIPGRSDTFYMNGAVTYAALTSTLRPESATTNKVVRGVSAIRYNLSQRQLNALTGAKYVTFRLKNNQVVVTDGITTAPDRILGGSVQASDYARLSTLRITQATTQTVRDLCEPFIGEPNRMPQYNALNATIKGGLEAMKTQGVIFDYRFAVNARSGSLSEAVVTLEIVPALELRRISINVNLRPQYLMGEE